MTRERRALGAFLVLATLATVFAVVLRPGSAPRRAELAIRSRSASCCGDVPSSRPRAVARAEALSRVLAAKASSRAVAEAVAARGRRQQPAAKTCSSVPLYPLARPTPHHRDIALLRALNRVPGVPVVTRMERFSLGTDAWLGASGTPVSFAFYRHRMLPIWFATIPASTRREIGVRPTGTIDSPPLLFVNGTGAALLQGVDGGVVRLTLFCGAVEL